MASFYREQRKRLDILMNGRKPAGGKWSFDKENRKKLPQGHQVPEVSFTSNRYIKEAVKYVEKHFPDNPGESSGFIYPVTFRDSKRWFKNFVNERLEFFGDYEDAISEKEPFLYHSVISPLLNVGLLTPDNVVKEVLDADVPINSKEGFIRQVIGWREFILQIYLLEGEKQRRSNFFQNRRKLPSSFYKGETGVYPVDTLIKRLLKTGYLHHIERLMVLGNYMLLKRYDPDHVYRWFMEMFIDSYDWVMVPNVYGMSQYADGGLMATKPYISSSNYLLKMSDFKRGEWCQVWDALFWEFIEDHKDKLEANPRMNLILKILEKRHK